MPIISKSCNHITRGSGEVFLVVPGTVFAISLPIFGLHSTQGPSLKIPSVLPGFTLTDSIQTPMCARSFSQDIEYNARLYSDGLLVLRVSLIVDAFCSIAKMSIP